MGESGGSLAPRQVSWIALGVAQGAYHPGRDNRSLRKPNRLMNGSIWQIAFFSSVEEICAQVEISQILSLALVDFATNYDKLGGHDGPSGLWRATLPCH